MKEWQEYFFCGKGGRCVVLTLQPYVPFVSQSKSLHLEPPGLVQGLLFSLLVLHYILYVLFFVRFFIDVFPSETVRLMASDSYWLTQISGAVSPAPLD
jgi:hypothetical protein